MATDRKKIALIGAKGMLAQAIKHRCPESYLVHGYDLPEFDMTDREHVFSTLADLQPDVIINCAAFTQVDACETQEELATAVNGAAVGFLAVAAKEIGATLVHISTDYVFDGKKQQPYLESDAVAPQSAYGRSKLVGEQAIAQSGLNKYFIIRTSWLYGPGGNNFVETMIRVARERDELRVVADQVGSPTYTDDLAAAIFSLLSLGNCHPSAITPYGTYHVSNNGSCSWYEFATEIISLARKAGEPIKTQKILPIATEDYPLPAPRPAYSVFSKDKYNQVTGQVIPDWQTSLSTYIKARTTKLASSTILESRRDK